MTFSYNRRYTQSPWAKSCLSLGTRSGRKKFEKFLQRPTKEFSIDICEHCALLQGLGGSRMNRS